MVNRTLPIVVILGAVAYSCSHGAPRTGKGAEADGNITALQRKRVELLAERVSKLQELHDAKLVDRTDLIASQIDLVNAQLDYAQSKGDQRRLLTTLIEHYDEQIRLAEFALKAPAVPPNAGERARAHGLTEMSKVLFLKSERIRIEIERAALE